MVSKSDTLGPRVSAPILVDRIYKSTRGGLALRANRGSLTTYEAVSFNEAFRPAHIFKLAGAPSRTRVSKSGKLGASTVFVTGDSYNSGGFSTRTTIYNVAAGSIVADLEDFKIEREGRSWKKADFNFWGVTFAPDDETFYATLFSGQMPYLIRGSISKRQAVVIHDHVECPSLSPNGKMIAFKSRETIQTRRIWLLKVLDLSTGVVSSTQEQRNVDDQPEWMDDARIAYSLPHERGAGSDIWAVSITSGKMPELIIPDAYSPCVVIP